MMTEGIMYERLIDCQFLNKRITYLLTYLLTCLHWELLLRVLASQMTEWLDTLVRRSVVYVDRTRLSCATRYEESVATSTIVLHLRPVHGFDSSGDRNYRRRETQTCIVQSATDTLIFFLAHMVGFRRGACSYPHSADPQSLTKKLYLLGERLCSWTHWELPPQTP